MSKMNEFICNDALLQQIRLNLQKFKVMSHERDGLKKAAVAITIVDVFHGPDMHGLSKPDLRDKSHESRLAHAGGRNLDCGTDGRQYLSVSGSGDSG